MCRWQKSYEINSRIYNMKNIIIKTKNIIKIFIYTKNYKNLKLIKKNKIIAPQNIFLSIK